MTKSSWRIIAVFSLLAGAACNRDPNFVKQQYVQSGNKYYERGRYREALIMYRKALAKDQKYGLAYYRMALTSLKIGQVASATGPLRRAVELLPPGSPEWSDASLKLAGIVLHVAQEIDVPGKNAEMIREVEQIRDNLLARNANSFAGAKLTGDLLLLKSVDYFRRGDKAESEDAVAQALAKYRQAIAIDPNDLPVRIALARTLSLRKEFSEAEQVYRYVIGRDPHLTAAQTELYRLLVSAGKPAEAEQVLKEASTANPGDHGYELLLAAHYYALKDKPSMKRVLDKLEGEYSEFPSAYFTAGDFYLRVGDSNSAMQQYEAGMKRDPNNKVAYQKRLIEALIRQGRNREAFDKDLELLKDNPRDPEARGMKASFLLDKGDVNQAIVELQQVVTAKPENFVARYNLGRAHFAKGEYEQASQQFSAAIKLRPDYLRARLGLAQVALMQGGYDRALKAAQEAQQFSPNSQAAKLLEAAALMRLQRSGDARTKLDALLQSDPNQPEVLLELGVLDISEKRYPEAAQLFHKAFEVNPGNVKGLMGEAEAYYLQNQPQKAITLLETAAQKYPNRADIQRELAAAHLRVNANDDALRELQALVVRFQNSPHEQGEAYATIGQLYNRRGKTREALEMLAKARQLSPDNVGILNYYAQCLDRSGQRELAKQVYRDALAKDPGNAETLNNLAFLLADLGTDLDQALTLANRAKQKLPNMVEVSDTIGWIYLKKNLSDSATDVFRDLNAKVPNNPTFHLHYCMALAQKGDRGAASKECKTAMSLKPPPEDAAQLRELLAKLG